ncbi:hypothetical protein [Microbulbifer variabilis]|nr:hypothetical protein [Microbulbifer variabilis]
MANIIGVEKAKKVPRDSKYSTNEKATNIHRHKKRYIGISLEGKKEK